MSSEQLLEVLSLNRTPWSDWLTADTHHLSGGVSAESDAYPCRITVFGPCVSAACPDQVGFEMLASHPLPCHLSLVVSTTPFVTLFLAPVSNDLALMLHVQDILELAFQDLAFLQKQAKGASVSHVPSLLRQCVFS